MMRTLLGGAAVAALLAVSASAAWANPTNTFATDNETTVNSTATATTGSGGAGGDASGGSNDTEDTGSGGVTAGAGGTGGAGGAGGGSATATSESYNTAQDGISHQDLSSTVSGNEVYAEWDHGDGDLSSGSASVGGFDNAAGINIASASSGHQSVNQQAVSLGIVGTVNLNKN